MRHIKALTKDHQGRLRDPITKHVSFRFEPGVIAALDAIKRRDGIPVSEQVRRAVDAWIALHARAVEDEVRAILLRNKRRRA
jgi:hypothetical protein